jgi:phage/plasmid-associated DNA primase
LKTGKAIVHSPDLFTTHSLSFDYDPNAVDSPKFDQFINDLSSGHVDRRQYLLSLMHVVVTSKLNYQIVIFIHGPAASGKSAWVMLLKALVGHASVMATTLGAMSGDHFEASNLPGKKLVVIADTNGMLKDSSLIKAYSGGDDLRGRSMHVGTTTNIAPEGIIVIVGNESLTLDRPDFNNGFTRRLRTFETEIRSESREPLLFIEDTEWSGPLAPELPAIFNKVVSLSPKLVDAFMLRFEENVPSMQGSFSKTRGNLNSVFEWSKEQLIPSAVRTPVGYVGQTKGISSVTNFSFLSPTYNDYCKARGIKAVSHTKFSDMVIDACKSMGWEVNKGRDKNGMYIYGVKVDSKVSDIEYIAGGSFDHSTDDTTRNSNANKPEDEWNKAPVSETTKHIISHPVTKELPIDLMEQYVNYLTKKNSLRRDLNNFIKKLPVGLNLVDELITKYCKNVGAKNPSEEFLKNKTDHFTRAIEIVKHNGVTVYEYKSLGNSPRIQPGRPGKTLYSFNKVFRNYLFEHMGLFLKENYGMVILDLDLISCYTSVLCGLYPHKLPLVKKAVETIGIWRFIEKEFERKGVKDKFNKQYVKICFYSVIFGGGSKAMVDGIIDQQRKAFGMVLKQYEKTDEFQNTQFEAKLIANIMNELEVVQQFRDCSQSIVRENENGFLFGPMGFRMKITKADFRNSLPIYLQEFEGALLQYPVICALKEFAKSELLYSFHDGCVIAIKESEKEAFLDYLMAKVLETGGLLKLKFPQRIELQNIYPSKNGLDDFK